jgi:hypothetical protein
LVDDSSKPIRGEGEGLRPEGAPASLDFEGSSDKADSILRLLKARLELPDLSPSGSMRVGGHAASVDPSLSTAGTEHARIPGAEPLEMTPTPMVADSGPAQGAAAENSWGSNANAMASDDPVGSETMVAHSEYHPPRKPPTSVAPPPVGASFSVATEFDPKAPTKPKVRRTTVPPPALLFGTDRMLVWGLVLGGLFVALIVVIVRQLVPPAAPRGILTDAVRVDEPGALDSSSYANRPLAPATDSLPPRELASDGATGRFRPALKSREPAGVGEGVHDAGIAPTASVSQGTWNAPPAASLAADAVQKAAGVGGGGGKPAQRGTTHLNQAATEPRRSWIE